MDVFRSHVRLQRTTATFLLFIPDSLEATISTRGEKDRDNFDMIFDELSNVFFFSFSPNTSVNRVSTRGGGTKLAQSTGTARINVNSDLNSNSSP